MTRHLHQADLFGALDRRRSYPAYPGFKAGGPSAAAADVIAPFAPTLRVRALAELRKLENAEGMTSDEVATALSSTEFAIRPRISELKRSGAVSDSGTRRPNRSGVLATVWKARQCGRTV